MMRIKGPFRAAVSLSPKKQNMSPPTTQELGVGSSAWMETMSTHPSTAVPFSLHTTMWRPDASTLPLFMNWLDFSESPSSDSKKKVATGDRYSVWSSDSGVSVDSGSSETSCVSMKSDRSRGISPDFKGKTEKTSSSTTQELVVGSSAEMETKSTHPPLTTIQLAGASASSPCNKR